MTQSTDARPAPGKTSNTTPNPTLERGSEIRTGPQGELSGRAVPEWIGATPDTKVPASVRLRVFREHGGRCHISGRKIRPADKWDLDHVKALCNDGENRESNLAPAIRDKHREKTKADVKERVKTDNMAKSHLGLKPKSRWFSSNLRRKMDGSVVRIEPKSNEADHG